jgi:hypothetical protein
VAARRLSVTSGAKGEDLADLDDYGTAHKRSEGAPRPTPHERLKMRLSTRTRPRSSPGRPLEGEQLADCKRKRLSCFVSW